MGFADNVATGPVDFAPRAVVVALGVPFERAVVAQYLAALPPCRAVRATHHIGTVAAAACPAWANTPRAVMSSVANTLI